MALNDLIVQAIAGSRGSTTSQFIGEVKNSSGNNALAILKAQLEKIKSADALTDSQRATRQRLTGEKKEVSTRSGLLSNLNDQLSQLGNLANQLNGLGGLRAEETKTVKTQKEIKTQKEVKTLGDPNSVTEANLSSEKLKLGDADVLFGGSVTPNQRVTVQIVVGTGATNIQGLTNGAEFTAERVGTSDQVQLLDSQGNVVNIGGTGTGNQKDISGITLKRVSTSTIEETTIQETLEQKRQADLKKIRETFGAFTAQIDTVKSFLSENTKAGGALQNDTGAKQLLAELDKATKQLSGLDDKDISQGVEKSFAKFERIGRTTAVSVSEVATRFAGPGSVLGREISTLKTQTRGIDNQLATLAKVEEQNRKELQSAAADITKAALSIGSQKAFLQKVGNESGSTATPRSAASIGLNIPKLPGSAPTGIGAATSAVV